MSERTLLAQMLWDLKESGEGLSLKKMVSRSGNLLSVSTLHAVMHGRTRELEPDTINGLAKILRISASQVLAALNNRRLEEGEQESLEKERLWEMYSDIPPQCKKDVMDLLNVLQRNHSVSARKERQAERRHKEAATVGGRFIAPLLDKGKMQPVDPTAYGINRVKLPDDQAGDSPEEKEPKRRAQ